MRVFLVTTIARVEMPEIDEHLTQLAAVKMGCATVEALRGDARFSSAKVMLEDSTVDEEN